MIQLLMILAFVPKQILPSENKPFFSPSPNEVKAQEGGKSFLECEVYNRANLSVSWVRLEPDSAKPVGFDFFL